LLDVFSRHHTRCQPLVSGSTFYYGEEIKVDEMGWTCSTHGRDETHEFEGKYHLGYRRRWEDNSGMDLTEVKCEREWNTFWCLRMGAMRDN
jgi:hypothetical protein